MCVPILNVHRDQAGDITHIGGSTPDGRPWGLTLSEAISRIQLHVYDFVVTVPIGFTVPVVVRTRPNGRNYLTTSPDGVLANNLDSLPMIQTPLAGVDPPYPLSIPDLLDRFVVKGVRVTEPGHKIYNDGNEYPYHSPPRVPFVQVPERIWTSPDPEWIYLRAVVPFPATYQVLVDDRELERVSATSPGRRFALEAAGEGWWTFELDLTGPDGKIDPTKPDRYTPANIVVRPPAAAWSAQDFRLSVRCGTVNPFCVGRDAKTGQTYHTHQSGSVTLRLVAYIPVKPPPPPQPVRLPSVVGQRLDNALNALWVLGLDHVFVFGPSGVMSTELQVSSQTPAAGTQVPRDESIYLSARLTVPQTGVKRVLVNNQSGRAADNELWIFDYTAGTWSDHGSVAYQKDAIVDNLPDGHMCWLVTVDSTIPECRTDRPDELDCVYQHMTGTFVADSQGADVHWQIL